MNSTAPDYSNALGRPAVREALASSQWHASLELLFRQKSGSSRLVRNHHQGPLCVQRPFYPEGPDMSHVYILHPPGGLVSGDCLLVSVEMEEDAKALLTTPGAGRIYGARSDRCLQQQSNRITVGKGASCEWFPQETIIYRNAHTSLATNVNLSEGSVFLGWEITVLGLPASDSLFDQGEVRQRLSITREGRPLLMENLQVNNYSRNIYSAIAGMRSLPVNGIFVAGPVADAALSGQGEHASKVSNLLDALRDARAFEADERATPCHWGISLVGEFIVARYLGCCTEQARILFIQLWTLLRPFLLGREACKPGIWAT